MDYKKADLGTARKNRELLGLDFVSPDEFERIIKDALRNYQPFSNISAGLTWPEFIVVTAKRIGYETHNEKLKESLQKLELIATICGVSRGSTQMDAFFTWSGWKQLV